MSNPYNSSIPPQDSHPHKWDYSPCYYCGNEVSLTTDTPQHESGWPLCEDCANHKRLENTKPSKYFAFYSHCSCGWQSRGGTPVNVDRQFEEHITDGDPS